MTPANIATLGLRRVQCCEHPLRQIAVTRAVRYRHRWPYTAAQHHVGLHGKLFANELTSFRNRGLAGMSRNEVRAVNHSDLPELPANIRRW